jgi:hypothetical protein
MTVTRDCPDCGEILLKTADGGFHCIQCQWSGDREDAPEPTGTPVDVRATVSGSVTVEVPDPWTYRDTRPVTMGPDAARRFAEALEVAADDAERREDRELETDGGVDMDPWPITLTVYVEGGEVDRVNFSAPMEWVTEHPSGNLETEASELAVGELTDGVVTVDVHESGTLSVVDTEPAGVETDGGVDWTDEYETTTYRGPQPYPVPGAWVLGMVEGDGIGWKHFPGVGEDLSHDDEVGEADPDRYFEGADAHADLILQYPPGADALEDPPYHELKLDGEVVMVLKDASEVSEPEWWTAIAETLARYDSGGDVGTVLSDLGLEHLKADPFGAREDGEDGDDADGDHSLDEFATDGGVDALPDTVPLPEWERKAHENVQKWGLQSPDALLLAMGEEMGELAGEVHGMADYPDADGMDAVKAEQGRDLIRRMDDLGRDIRDFLESVSEDREGEPIPEGERVVYLDVFPPDLKRSRRARLIRSELDDLMALGYQFLWALDGEEHGGDA